MAIAQTEMAPANGLERPFHPVHPLPTWRLAMALGRTARAVFQVKAGTVPRTVLGAWATDFLASLNIQVELTSPLPIGAQLWASNHLSWLDPLVCLHLRPSACLAKAEVAEYPLVGHAARAAGLRFVKREVPLSRAAALVRLAADLRRGEDMLIFPEGTTTRGERLAPLQEGSLRAAYRLGTSLLPIRLFCREAHYPWTGDESLLPHLLALTRAHHTRVLVHPGPLLNPHDFTSEAHWVRTIEIHLSPHTQDLRGCA
jgi:1-acyl-sn-glycerol-3-phosphate acyltransferase